MFWKKKFRLQRIVVIVFKDKLCHNFSIYQHISRAVLKQQWQRNMAFFCLLDDDFIKILQTQLITIIHRHWRLYNSTRTLPRPENQGSGFPAAIYNGIFTGFTGLISTSTTLPLLALGVEKINSLLNQSQTAWQTDCRQAKAGQ